MTCSVIPINCNVIVAFTCSLMLSLQFFLAVNSQIKMTIFENTIFPNFLQPLSIYVSFSVVLISTDMREDSE